MDSRFVDGDVQFAELEDVVLSSFNVGSPVLYCCVVVLWGGPFFAEELLEEVARVAVYTGYACLDEGICYTVDDLVIQPWSVIQIDEATFLDRM